MKVVKENKPQALKHYPNLEVLSKKKPEGGYPTGI